MNLRDRRNFVQGLLAFSLSSLVSCASMSSGDRRPVSCFKTDADKKRYLARYAAVLEEWPQPFEELYVPTAFGKTHVIVNGPHEGPSLVLLSAHDASATIWRPNIAALSKYFRTYAVDILGEPNKSEPTRALKSEQDFANWLADVLDELNIERANLVGNSFGASIALNQVVLDSPCVASAVLIAPPVFPLSRRFYFYGGLGNVLGLKSYRSRMDAWMENGIPLDPSNDRWLALHDSPNIKSIDSVIIRISEQEWQGIETPMLLLIGEKDVIYRDPPKEVLAKAKKRMPTLHVDIVPKANHVAAMSNPAFVNQRIIRFLKTGA